MSIDRDGKHYRPVCDRCGMILPRAKSFDKANQLADFAHWVAVKTETGTLHYCPDCQLRGGEHHARSNH